VSHHDACLLPRFLAGIGAALAVAGSLAGCSPQGTHAKNGNISHATASSPRQLVLSPQDMNLIIKWIDAELARDSQTWKNKTYEAGSLRKVEVFSGSYEAFRLGMISDVKGTIGLDNGNREDIVVGITGGKVFKVCFVGENKCHPPATDDAIAAAKLAPGSGEAVVKSNPPDGR
jgi:hypothetical protein